MKAPPSIQGYVRCGVTFVEADLNFEMLANEPKVAVLTLETIDGNVDVGLNRRDATALLQKLQLFLDDWPEESKPS